MTLLDTLIQGATTFDGESIEPRRLAVGIPDEKIAYVGDELAGAAGGAAVIAEIYNASIAVGGATMDQDPKIAADVRRQMASFGRRETILPLEQGHPQEAAPRGQSHNVLGWGIIKKYSDGSGYRFCCETAVYLRRDLTGRGLGTRIKLALIERCRCYGYHHLVAKIFAANVEYNKKLGYEVVGTQREIGYADGRWQDVVILQLVLDDVPTQVPAEYQSPSAWTEPT